MKKENIKLKYKKNKVVLEVRKCNLIEQFLGLMVFRNDALLLFDFKTKKKTKIHSFFCKPFLAVYTDEKYNVLEIINVTSWKTIISPRVKFNKLIEIPIIPKYVSQIKKLNP